MSLLEIKKDKLLLDGEQFYLASGDMHYFRYFKGGWKRRLQLMKDFGLTAVQTYVPWNLHEPEEGEFDFFDNLDVAAFLELCQEIGLKVLFRPSPYICSEWEFGGMPYWILNKKDACVRTSEPGFMRAVKKYYERLAREFVPYLSTNGGPIIAVAIENEYGSFGEDEEYIKGLGDMLRELGVDVPFFTANGFEDFKLANGSRKEYWTGLDLHELHDDAKKAINAYQPDKPILIPEFWPGRCQQWGVSFQRQSAEEVAEKYKRMLNDGAYVNFYMFCGGTNYGFTNGALVFICPDDTIDTPAKYIPNCTSYDTDALVDEAGAPTPKYFACKKALAEYLKSKGIKNSAKESLEYEKKTQSIKDVKINKKTDLFKNLDKLAVKTKKSHRPKTFESLNQAYGFVVYETFIKHSDDALRKLTITDLHDCAYVFSDGKYLGTYMRDRDNKPITFVVPKCGMKLQIIVENMGRARNGSHMLDEFKGILGYVKLDVVNEDGSIYLYNWTMKMNWTNYSLPLKDISVLDYNKEYKSGPVFLKGEFKATPGVDTFVNSKGFKKGVIWINGFNIGRFWEVGPQGTLYVPGEILKENNTIEMLELIPENLPETIDFEDCAILDTIKGLKSTDLIFNTAE